MQKTLMKNLVFIIAFLFVYEIGCQEEFQAGNGKRHVLMEEHRTRNRNAQMKQLVENAAKHLQKVPLEEALYDFIYNPIWRKGELYVFVYDENGNCLAQGDDSDLIWKSIGNLKSVSRIPLLQQMLNSSKGARVSYSWNNSYISAYVKTVEKDGKRYILGGGFYPQNPRYTAKTLAQTAAAYFYSSGKDDTFALMSEHEGPFVKGDIYAWAMDFDGICVANSENPALMGQSVIDLTDDKNQPVNKNMIKIAKEKGSGWVDYYSQGDSKRSYFLKVVDPKTKKAYLLIADYYPNESLQTVETFVHRAVSFLKANGAQVAFKEFSNKVGQFIQGALSIFVYDMQGNCVANGDLPSLVGQNLLKRKDQNGKFMVQEILRIANKYGRGFASYHVRNTFMLAYVVKVEIPDGKFVVVCEYAPDSKTKTVEAFVNKAIEYFKSHTRFEAFDKFSSRQGGFLQGDLSVFVYDQKGFRLVNGVRKNQIWRNFSKSTDQDGKPVVQDIITLAINGGGWYEYKLLNAIRRVYVQSVDKDNESFIIGSGYFM